MWFDLDDMDAAIAELDAAYAQLEAEQPAGATSQRSQPSRGTSERSIWAIGAGMTSLLCLPTTSGSKSAAGDSPRKRRAGSTDDRGARDRRTRRQDHHVRIPVAIRGERLVLSRVRFSGRDVRPDAYRTDMFRLAEIDNDGRVVSYMKFDIEDLDAAMAELDARYLVGEAAPCAHVVGRSRRLSPHSTGANSPRTTPDSVTVDHRLRDQRSQPADLTDIRPRHVGPRRRTSDIYIEAVHRLSDLGAVVTHGGNVGPRKRASMPSGG